MVIKIEDLRRRKNVLVVLACFENNSNLRFKDIREKCGKKLIKTRGRTEGLEDEQIFRVLEWLKKIEFIKKENGKYRSINRHFDVIKRANDEVLLNKYPIENTIFLPKLSIYGLRKDFIKNTKIAEIEKAIQEQVTKLLEAKKKIKSKKIKLKYDEELKKIKDRKLKSLIRGYQNWIADFLLHDLSDESIKRFIFRLPFTKGTKKIILSDKEKEEMGNFCTEVIKDIREEFSPMRITILCRSNQRGVSDLLSIV